MIKGAFFSYIQSKRETSASNKNTKPKSNVQTLKAQRILNDVGEE
jgi:hypothetical protein